MPHPTTSTQPFRLRFGAEVSSPQQLASATELQLAVPVLAGAPEQVLLPGGSVEKRGSFLIAESGSRLAGAASLPAEGSLEAPAHQLYRELLQILEGRTVHRFWNYVPDINGHRDGLENYRSFNIGRHAAFENHFGGSCTERMSPASAVGAEGDHVAVAFIAGTDPIQNIENPEQTPAYRYPEVHGPKSPSFTRGAHGIIEGTPYGILSGTSSIKDHRSIGEDLPSQFATTIDNMRIVIERMGYSGALGDGAGMRREFTFYLRRADDLGAARELFRGVVGDSGIANTRFLRADICRAELLLEIEGLFWRP